MNKLHSFQKKPHDALAVSLPMPPSIDFDIEGLMSLAKRDPEGFERVTRCLIDDFLSRSECNQMALRRLQFRIDSVRYRARTPLKACLKISGMMWESFLQLNDRLQEMSQSGATKHLVAIKSGQEKASRTADDLG